MGWMHSVFNLLAAGKTPSQAELVLIDAYTSFVHGSASSVELQMVLVDLARFTGYFDTSPPSTSNEALRFREGQRAVMERIIMLSNLTDAERTRLEGAAREEAAAYKTEETETP